MIAFTFLKKRASAVYGFRTSLNLSSVTSAYLCPEGSFGISLDLRSKHNKFILSILSSRKTWDKFAWEVSCVSLDVSTCPAKKSSKPEGREVINQTNLYWCLRGSISQQDRNSVREAGSIVPRVKIRGLVIVDRGDKNICGRGLRSVGNAQGPLFGKWAA